MAEHARDEKDIFFAALEKPTPQERNAFVEGACAGDPELLERVRELLATHEESVGPLDSPPPGVQATVNHPIPEGPGFPRAAPSVYILSLMTVPFHFLYNRREQLSQKTRSCPL